MLRVKSLTGSALRAERDRRHLTQAEAAAQAGVAKRTWQLWESAEEVIPQPKHRRALVAWLESEAEAVA